MNKIEIQNLIVQKHFEFIQFIDGLGEQDFLKRKDGKWSAGEQIAHIYLSVRPLVLVLYLPKFLLKLMFGRRNRPIKSYTEIVNKYHKGLLEKGGATGPYIPKIVEFSEKEKLNNKLKKLLLILKKKIDTFNEEELDYYMLPHPRLRKITLREMMYFTIYHVEHHLEITKRNLMATN